MHGKKRPDFKRLAAVNVTSKRAIVISYNEDENKILIGQRIKTMDEDQQEINFFLKGALSIPESELESFQAAITLAVKKLKELKKSQKELYTEY